MLSRNVDATSNQRTNKTHAVALKMLVSKTHWKDVEKTPEKTSENWAILWCLLT